MDPINTRTGGYCTQRLGVDGEDKSDLGTNWVRLAPNEINAGLFQIGAPKCTEI